MTGATVVPWDLESAEERDYFGRWGNGLVVVLPGERPGVPGSSYRGPPHGGAWVHVGEDGRARAATGKVEVGQGTREALHLLVCEELRLPLERVEIIMGDTDICPWDVGTYGSRSMPDAGERLRGLSAATRSLLMEMGRRKLGLDASTPLTVEKGRVVSSSSYASVSFGEIVRGERRLEVVRVPATTQPADKWARAGRPAVELRPTGVVTGARRYTSDLRVPGMLYGKVLYPPAYGARLRKVNTRRASEMDGVTVVQDGPFVGVVAPTPLSAEAARSALEPDWEFTPQPSEGETPSFLAQHPVEGEDAWDVVHHSAGEFERAFAEAPLQARAHYTAAFVAHIPMETRCAVATWADGRLTVYVGTQTPFRLRAELARRLGVSEASVRVVVPPTGSGFGGKGGSNVALDSARLARAVGQPVRLALDRTEEFTQGYFRPMAVIDIASGCDASAHIVAWKMSNLNAGAAGARTPYAIPNQSIDTQPTASPLPQGPYRALAATTNNFGRESHIDELAVAASVDPLEFRLRNLTDERLRTVLTRVAERAGWAGRVKRDGSGRGIALGLEKGARVATVAEVHVSPQRRLEVVRVVTGLECGAVVHPDNLTNQVQGATVMALGGALFEALHFDRGRVLNPRFSQYRVPRFRDVPPIEVELINRTDLPFAGAGETPMIAVAPAVANAIFDATGRRLRDLPLVPSGRIP